MNLPNKLTILRVILVPIFMALLLMSNIGAQIAALIVFALASLTDMLDGKIARKYNLITNFGKFMDPLADKMLTTAAFIVFLQKGIINSWPLMIILTREFMVSGIRLVAASEGNVIAAAFWGKFKTVAQMAAIMATIILTMDLQFIPMPTGVLIPQILIWISVVFTVFSGIEYLIKNINLLKNC